MRKEILNLSAEPENKLFSWIPHDLEYDKIVFFSDACPGKSPLPTGTAVLTYQHDWRKFAVSDIGCGMLMVKSNSTLSDFDYKAWDEVCNRLRNIKEDYGSIGSGNHFCDCFCSLKDERLYFVVHTGSRHEGKKVEALIDNPNAFDKEYVSTIEWAKENRMAVMAVVEKVFGKVEYVLDLSHNSYEFQDDGAVIIRKGSVKVKPGNLTIIPSSMDGDMVLIEATAEVDGCLNSLNHGTGRTQSRSQAKEYAEKYDYNALRKRIYIPESISDASIRTEAPFCYRNLDDCLNLLNGVIKEVERFSPIAYIGQL